MSFQLILKASSGIDYAEFYTFIHTIGAKRHNFLENCSKDVSKSDENKGQSDVTGCFADESVKSGHGGGMDKDPRIFQGSKVPSQPYYLTKNHAIFDFSRIREVVTDMVNDTEFKLLDITNFSEDPHDFLKKIDETLLKFRHP